MKKSIFKNITLTPQAFEEKYNMEDIIDRFANLLKLLEILPNSGLIIGLSKNQWMQEINEYIRLYDDKNRKKLQSLLENLDSRNRIVYHPDFFESSNKEQSWINKAKSLNEIRAFDAIVTTMDDGIVKSVKSLKTEEYQNTGASVSLQTTSNMQDYLYPILSYAEIVTIIDPYFRLSKKEYRDSLNLIGELLGNSHGIKHKRVIEIQTSIKALLNKDDEFDWRLVNQWPEEIKKIETKYKHNITINIWEDLKREDQWHDRWFITNQCGVFMGKGSDVSNWTDSTWGLLNWNEIPNITNKFNKNRSKYTYIGQVTSKGIKKENKPMSKTQYRSEEERQQKLKNVKDFRKK